MSGTFGASVNTNLPSNFSTGLSYDAHDAYLDLSLNFTPASAPNFGSTNFARPAAATARLR